MLQPLEDASCHLPQQFHDLLLKYYARRNDGSPERPNCILTRQVLSLIEDVGTFFFGYLQQAARPSQESASLSDVTNIGM